MSGYKLEKWNLDELIKNPTRNNIDKKLADIEKNVKQFEKVKKSLNPKISPTKFMKILHDIENISEKSSKVGGYASLRYSENTQSDEATALLSKISKFGADIENRMLFFDLWWKKKIDEKNARRLMKFTGNLTDYLRFKRLLSKYSLSEP